MPVLAALGADLQQKILENYRNPEVALRIVLTLPVTKLLQAKILSLNTPDLENPGGYFHRSVVLEYPGWFGRIRRKRIFLERSAFDDSKQKEVVRRVGKLFEAIRSAL